MRRLGRKMPLEGWVSGKRFIGMHLVVQPGHRLLSCISGISCAICRRLAANARKSSLAGIG